MSAFAIAAVVAAIAATAPIQYPDSKRSDFKETLHGVEVADPYRWLEEMDSADTKAWVAAQNQITNTYLNGIPERERIANRFKQLFNFEKYGTPIKFGGRYFWSENTGLQNQDVWYWSETLGKNKKVLINPNGLSKDGTVALNGFSVSWDGKYLAYGLSRGGSDWVEWRVREVKTGKDLADKIEWSKFSNASWSADNKGFYYSRYDAPKAGQKLAEQNYFQKVYFHRIGTAQSKDTLVYERKDQKTWGFSASATEDGRYLVYSVWDGTARENRVFYKDLRDRSLIVRELLPKGDAQYNFLGNEGPIFYFQTDKNAPLGRVIGINVGRPDSKFWINVVPQKTEKLEAASLTGGRIFANYLKDAYTQVQVYRTNGKREDDVKMPGIGTGGGFAGTSKDTETYYSYASFDTPTTIYKYAIRSGKSTKVFQPKVKFNPSDYVTKQVFYKSKDGTRVPMFISHKKGLKLDGTNPTLLYAYGGFNSSMTPFFSPSRMLWMEMGGVSAVACIRGGGEYGVKWHDGGRLFKKQNVFDDFIAGSEFLINSKYTNSKKLAIQGGSNGGLLIGAVMNQRPDLFGVCFPEVGVMDMLRFHKFTIGWAWVSDYGSPDKEKDFKYLLGYSPLHNLKPGTNYPATLVITGDHDDRVVPAHSYKYAAALQYSQAGEAPVLIRIETQAGHGAGKPTQKIIEEVADKWSFAVKNLDWKIPANLGK